MTAHLDGQRHIGVAAAFINIYGIRVVQQCDDVIFVCFRKRVVERVIERARALISCDVRRKGGQRKERGTDKQDDGKSAQVFSHSYLPSVRKIVSRQK